MPQRPSPTRASSGGSSKDISPWLGLIAALTGTGAATGGPTGDVSAVNGANASYASPEAMMASGDKMATSGTDANPLITPKPQVMAQGGFTPYKASTWSNIASRGQAGMQANQLNAGIYQQQLTDAAALERGKAIQQLVNEGQLDVTKLTGKNAQDLAVAQGQQQRLTQAANTDNTLMNTFGLPTSRLPDYNNTVAPLALDLSKQRAANENQLAGLTNEVQAKPNFAANFEAGINAKNYSPVVANTANAIKVGQGDAAYANPFMGSNTGYFGSMPGGITKTTGFDPKTLQSIETTTMSSPTGAGMFNINPQTGKRNIGMPMTLAKDNGGAVLSSGEGLIKEQGNGANPPGIVNPVRGASGSWDTALVTPKPIMYGPPAPFNYNSNSQGLNNFINTLVNGTGQTNGYDSNTQTLNNLINMLSNHKQ